MDNSSGSLPARRVVTGHDESGASIFLSDGPVPVVRTASEGAEFHEIWNTRAMPAPVAPSEPEPTEISLTVPPDAGGTKVRVNVFPPGVVSPRHRTESVDYGVVLEGEVTLVLDDSETVLRAGDVVVQRGTDHLWANRTDRPARMVFVLIDGAFTEELRKVLPENVSLHNEPFQPAVAP